MNMYRREILVASYALAGSIVLLSCPSDLTALSPSEVYQASISRVGVVNVLTISNAESQGSGFLLFPNVFVTCWHVVADAQKVSVIWSDGTSSPAQIIDADPTADVAILSLRSQTSPLPRATTDPLPGERLYVVGAPLGLSGSITEGLMSRKREIDDLTVFQFSNEVSPGSSGSPVLNSEGQVVGMVSFNIQDENQLNFGIPLDRIEDLSVDQDPLTFGEFRTRRMGNWYSLFSTWRVGDHIVSTWTYEYRIPSRGTVISRINRTEQILAIEPGGNVRVRVSSNEYVPGAEPEPEMVSDTRIYSPLNELLTVDGSHIQPSRQGRLFRAPRTDTIGMLVKVGDTWNSKLPPDETTGLPSVDYEFHFVGFEDIDGIRSARINCKAREMGTGVSVSGTWWCVEGVRILRFEYQFKGLHLGGEPVDLKVKGYLNEWKFSP